MKRAMLILGLLTYGSLALGQAPHTDLGPAAPAISPYLAYPTRLQDGAAPSPFAFLSPHWASLPEHDRAMLIRVFMGRDPAAWLDIHGHLPPPHYLAVAMHPTDRALMEDLLLFQQEKRWRVELAQLLMLIMQSERTIAFLERHTPSMRALVAKALAESKQDDSDGAVGRELDKRIAAEQALLADRRITYQLKVAEYQSYQGDAGAEESSGGVLDSALPQEPEADSAGPYFTPTRSTP